MNMVHYCRECGTSIHPVALLQGTRPGMSCNCSWETLSKREFKEMFGITFGQFKRRLEQQQKTYFAASGGAYSGNSHQRRVQRKRVIRLLRAEQERLHTPAI
jgi:hypothetical protein